MNNLRKAAKKALRVLETTWGIGSEDILKQWEETIEALRQALAEPEDPRIVELRKLMAEPRVTGVIFEVHRGPLSKSIREFGDCPCPTHVEGDVRIEVKDEPEGWVKIDEVRKYFDSVGCGTIYKTAGEDRVPLYLAPPKKEWVGLTDEELGKTVLANLNETLWTLTKDIEAKLKEKNT
jgi:hypothetical protein